MVLIAVTNHDQRTLSYQTTVDFAISIDNDLATPRKSAIKGKEELP